MANGFGVTVLPKRTGFQEFTEAASPYLQMAFQAMLQRQMQEQQRQRNFEMANQQRQKNIEQAQQMFPGMFSEQITPEGYDYAKSQLKTIGEGAAIQASMPSIPEKYKKKLFDVNKAPAGFQVKFGETGIPQFGYEKPDTLKLDKENRAIKNQDLARANQLRKEFIDRPEIKEFTSIRNKVSSMDALLTNTLQNDKTSRLALDQGLITLYNKITDPNSVVRESEYERTPQNLSLANRFSGAIEKLKQGGAGITNEDRKSLVWGAKIIANAQGKMFNERISQYSDIAQSYGVEPGLVTTGVEEFSPYSLEEQKQSIPQVGQFFNGEKVINVKRIE